HALQKASEHTSLSSRALRHAIFRRGFADAEKMESTNDPPARWKCVRLAEVAYGKYGLVDGPFGSNLKAVHYRPSGYPVLQSAFIALGDFNPDAADWVYVDEAKFQEQSRSAVRAGDIALVKVGVNCGACALLPDDFPTGILAGNCLKITPDRAICDPRYLLLH